MKKSEKAGASSLKRLAVSADGRAFFAGATPSKPVGSVVSAMRILRFLSQQTTPVSVTFVAKELGIYSSTCFHILRTLAFGGFVTFDPIAKAYSIGLGILELAHSPSIGGDEAIVLRSLLDKVAEEYEVTIGLWRGTLPDRMTLKFAAVPSRGVRIHMSVGQRMPLLVGASGRVMAAYLGLKPVQLRNQFQKIKWSQPLTFELFMRQVEEGKKRGWMVDDGQFIAGTATVSIPIFGRDDELIFSCAGTWFLGNFDKKRAQRFAQHIQGMSNSIARLASYL